MTALRKPRSNWSPEQRMAAANRCRQKSPWVKSTGPRTEAGKRISSQNALKHGRFSAETKSIRTWLCSVSRTIKLINGAYRHYEYMQKHLSKKISQNELSLHPSLCPLKHGTTYPVGPSHRRTG